MKSEDELKAIGDHMPSVVNETDDLSEKPWPAELKELLKRLWGGQINLQEFDGHCLRRIYSRQDWLSALAFKPAPIRPSMRDKPSKVEFRGSDDDYLAELSEWQKEHKRLWGGWEAARSCIEAENWAVKFRALEAFRFFHELPDSEKKSDDPEIEKRILAVLRMHGITDPARACKELLKKPITPTIPHKPPPEQGDLSL